MTVRPQHLLLAAAVLLLSAPGLPAAPREARSPAPEGAVDAYLGYWNGDDGAAAEDLVSDDFRRHARPGESPGSAAELAELVRRTRANFEQVTIAVDELFCDGDRCALRGVFTGRIPGTNRGVRIPLSAFYRVEAGRVAEEWVVSNQLPTMFGLGYQVAAPGTEVQPAESGTGPATGPPADGLSADRPAEPPADGGGS